MGKKETGLLWTDGLKHKGVDGGRTRTDPVLPGGLLTGLVPFPVLSGVDLVSGLRGRGFGR